MGGYKKEEGGYKMIWRGGGGVYFRSPMGEGGFIIYENSKMDMY